MNPDPDVRRILCFGDSNTHGAPADDPDYVRVPADQRWPGILQSLLGDDVEILEEGLSGRTTDVDYADRPGCNGRPYFAPCLRSHQPLDQVVIMLGTNDLKACFDRTPDAIAEALGGYLEDVATEVTDRQGRTPGVLLVSPILIDDTAPLWEETMAESYDATGVARSRELGAAIRRLAEQRGASYADAAEVATAGGDGLHLDLASHQRLAEHLAHRLRREGN